MSKKPHIIIAKQYLTNIAEFANPSESQDDKTCYSHLAWMLDKIVEDSMSDTKANRWLGYVQGIMVARSMLDVDAERNRTRSIFNNL